MINKLSLGGSENIANIETILHQTRNVICRIFFVRHGVSEDEINNGKNSKQLGNAELHEIGKAQMEEVALNLKKMGCNKDDTLILYSSGKDIPIDRIISSAEILVNNQIGKSKEHDALDTSEKIELPDGTIEIKDGWLFSRVEQFYQILDLTNNEILKSFTGENSLDYNQYKNIVLLGHKSNAGVSEIIKQEGQTIELCNKKINNGEIWEFDINENRKYMNYGQSKDILFINNNNIDSLILIFSDNEIINPYISLYNEGKIKIYELQNIINYLFKKDTSLCEKYLNSDIDYLRVFAFANYYKNNSKEKEVIISYLKGNAKQFSLGVWVSVFDIIKEDSKILEAYLNEFFSNAKNDNGYAKFKIEIFKSLNKLGEENMFLLNYYQNIYPLIKEIKEKSLDKRIAAGEDIHHTHRFSKEKYNDIENLLKDNGEHKIKYIEADAGSGKSFLLSNINQLLKDRDFEIDGKKYFPIFLSLSGLNTVEDIKDKIGVVESDYNIKEYMKDHQKVLVLDSLDESRLNENQRKELIKYLTTKISDYHIIISSRKGYIPIEDAETRKEGEQKIKDHLEEIELQGMQNTDEYVSSYFQQYEDRVNKIDQYNQFKSLNGSDAILSNPLMVTMVCNLIGNGISLAGVNTISDIYEKVIDMRLNGEQNKGQSTGRVIFVSKDTYPTIKEEYIKKIIDKRKTLLGELAYLSIIEDKTISQGMLLDSGVVGDDESLNLLFRKNSNQEYGFVHQSFKDYFAAREIVRKLKDSNKEVLEEVFGANLKNIDYNVLSFLVDYINTDSESAIKKIIINYIKNQRYYIGDIQYKHLYIYSKIDPESFKKYIELSYLNHDFFDYLRNHKELIKDKDFLGMMKQHIFSAGSKLFRGDFDLSDLGEEIIRELVSKKEFKEYYIWLSEALIKIGGEENIKIIKEIINNISGSKRARVIEVLCESCGEESISLIKEYLNDSDPSARCAVISALGKLCGEEVISIIKDYLNDTDSSVRSAVVCVLGRLGGEKNISLIKGYLNDVDGKVRGDAIRNLGVLYWKENTSIIKDYLNESDFNIRSNVISVLSDLGGEENIDIIRGLFNSSDEDAKYDIITKLSELGSKENIKTMLYLMENTILENEIPILSIHDDEGFKKLFKELGKDKINIIKRFFSNVNIDTDTILNLIWNLGYIGGDSASEILRDIIDYEGGQFYTEAVMLSLGRIGGEENMRLVRKFRNNKNEWLREYMIQILAGYGSTPKDLETIKSLRNDKSAIVRSGLVRALRQIHGEEVETIIGFANDSDSRVRYDVVQGLGRLGGEENSKIIKTFINDEDGSVRSQVVESLGRLGGEENIKIIKQIINNESGFIQSDHRLWTFGGQEYLEISEYEDGSAKKSFIDLLGKLGGEENIELIKSFRNEKDPEIRKKVIDIISKILGDTDYFVQDCIKTEIDVYQMRLERILGKIDPKLLDSNFSDDLKNVNQVVSIYNKEDINLKKELLHRVKNKSIELIENKQFILDAELFEEFMDYHDTRIVKKFINIMSKYPQ